MSVSERYLFDRNDQVNFNCSDTFTLKEREIDFTLTWYHPFTIQFIVASPFRYQFNKKKKRERKWNWPSISAFSLTYSIDSTYVYIERKVELWYINPMLMDKRKHLFFFFHWTIWLGHDIGCKDNCPNIYNQYLSNQGLINMIDTLTNWIAADDLSFSTSPTKSKRTKSKRSSKNPRNWGNIYKNQSTILRIV